MPGADLPIPFLTRDMLDYGKDTQLSLLVQTRGETAENYNLIGATRSGAFKYSFDGSNNRLLQSFTFALTDIPIFVTIRHNGIAEGPGRLYASVFLQMNGEPVLRLCSGYVNTFGTLSWPMVQSDALTGGHGNFKAPGGANPAANTELLVTVPSNEIWIVKGFTATLVTDGNAATRTVAFAITQMGSGISIPLVSATTQTASLTRKYNCYMYGGAVPAAETTNIYLNLPQGIVMQDGDTLTSVTTNLQVTDNWGAPTMFVEKFVLSLTD